MAAMAKWKRGKATGPDEISQEAIVKLAQDRQGMNVLVEEVRVSLAVLRPGAV